MNSVNIFGYIARDPEFRYTQNGTCVMSFTVAVNDRVKRGEQWEDIAHFVNCTLFGNRAQALEGKLTKSCGVCVSGKLRQQTWQDENGQNRSKLDVIALDLNVCKWAQEQTKSAAYAPQVQPDYTQGQFSTPQQFNQAPPQYNAAQGTQPAYNGQEFSPVPF